LLLFLTYPLGLGTWLGFTDTKVGRPGQWVGLENYECTCGATRWCGWRCSTRCSTRHGQRAEVRAGAVAGAAAEPQPCRFKTFFRAIILLPFIVPTVLSAIAFWWIYDSAVLDHLLVLMKIGLIDRYINFLGDPWNARWATIAPMSGAACPSSRSRCWPGCRPSRRRYYEAATPSTAPRPGSASAVTLPLLTPIIAVVMTFSVLFTFTDFQLIYVLTRGGPVNATHLMATLSFQRAIRAVRWARARPSRSR
jgi:multiple sugar transport system permease protein